MRRSVVWGRWGTRLGILFGATLALAGCGDGDDTARARPTCEGPADSGSEGFVHATPAQIACGLGRGVNFGNMFDAPEEGQWNIHYSPDWVPRVKEAGFSHIRLPVRWSNHAAPTADAALDEAFAARIDEVIELALGTDLYVVLDSHHYRQLDGDAVDAGETEVEADVVEERLVNIWRQLAARYHEHSNRLVYELYNEPHGRQTPALWNALAARTLAAVRESDAERVVIVGAAAWNEPGALPELKLPDDPNLIATFHHYEPYHFTFQGTIQPGSFAYVGTPCCDEIQRIQIGSGIEIGAVFARQHALPVYLGEFGVSSLADRPARVNYFRFVREQAESFGIPWAVWSLIDMGIYDASTESFLPEVTQALLGP